jgi:hypothetical protein
MQVAALAMLGRLDEAKSIARRLPELEPGFRIGPLEKLVGGTVRTEIVKFFVGSLQKAGLPE